MSTRSGDDSCYLFNHPVAETVSQTALTDEESHDFGRGLLIGIRLVSFEVKNDYSDHTGTVRRSPATLSVSWPSGHSSQPLRRDRLLLRLPSLETGVRQKLSESEPGAALN